MGSPAAGLLCGATLELFALETLPIGAARYPEWGSASMIGGGLYALQGDGHVGGLLTSVAIALLCAWLGGWSMVHLRKLNARWAERHGDAVASGSRKAIVGLQLYGLAADFLRGAVLTLAAVFVAMPVQATVLRTLEVNAALSRAVVVATATAVALSAVWKIFRAVPHARALFLAGVAAGLAVALAR